MSKHHEPNRQIHIPKLCEVEILFRPHILFEKENVTTPDHAAEIFRAYTPSDKIHMREQFNVLYLNRANDAIGITNHSIGGIAGTVVDLKIVFASAIKALASGIIISHNHPSGNTSPSKSDLKLTKQFSAAGEILDVLVLDHIIITANDYHSMAIENPECFVSSSDDALKELDWAKEKTPT